MLLSLNETPMGSLRPDLKREMKTTDAAVQCQTFRRDPEALVMALVAQSSEHGHLMTLRMHRLERDPLL